MMEYLLFLQPFASDMCWFCGVASVLAFLFSAIMFWALTDDNKNGKEGYQEERNVAKKYTKIITKTGCVLVGFWIIFLFVASTWNGYKLQMIHRVATSDTSEKAVENINKLLDMVGERLDEELEKQ